MKKILKSRIFLVIICAFFFSGIGTVFAYSLIASNVEFSPKDTSWKVTNTDEALNNLQAFATSKGFGLTDFSLEEKVIGTWIDNKSIYQKTIPFSYSGGSLATIATFTDIDTMINITGYVVESGIMYNVNNFNCRLKYNISSSTLFWEGRGDWSPISGYATIWYTKK